MDKIKDLKVRFLSWYSALGKGERKRFVNLVAFAVTVVVLFSLFFAGCVQVASASELADDLPDFAKAVSENTTVDLSKYPYYVVHYYKNDKGIVYDCLFVSSDDYVKYYSGCGVGRNLKLRPDGVYGDDSTGRTYGVRYQSYSGQYIYDYFGALIFFEENNNTVSEGGLLFSNFDVLNASDNSVFFQATPLLSYPTSIGGIITAQTVTAALTKEWIGLAPLLVGFLILVISLWKGLAKLYRVLRMA